MSPTGGAATRRTCSTQVLGPDELTVVATLVNLIIPLTDSPGACEAGVPAFIERALRRSAERAEVFHAGLMALDTASRQAFGAAFSDLSDAQRLRLLSDLGDRPDTPAGAFFVLVKNYAIDGYYTSREGLCGELGWRPPSPRRRYRGCTHPEHRG